MNQHLPVPRKMQKSGWPNGSSGARDRDGHRNNRRAQAQERDV